MINVDDVVKLSLALSASFAIIIIAWQIARLLSTTTDVVKEVKKTAENITEGTDLALNDYRKIHRLLNGVTDLLSSVTQVRSAVDGFLGLIGDRNDPKPSESKPSSEA